TSLSYNNVTKLLREEMDYQGISFTDALEMEAVAKYFPKGEVSARSLIAGNDMLCLPGDIEGSILEIKKAIRKKELTWPDINARVRKVLRAKYRAGLNEFTSLSTDNIVADLN